MKNLLPSCVGAALFSLALLSLPAGAQVPQLINYQGRVAVGTVNFNGTGLFKFALVNGNGSITYWSNDGSSTAGSEPTTAVVLTVTKGLYSVLLGDATLPNMTIVPATVFTNADVRLRVWFNDGTNGSQLLTPDQRIAAVGYAMMAAGVNLPATTSAGAGVIAQGGTRLMHAFGPLNFFAGAGAGNFTMTGQQNMASGVSALNGNSTGSFNTASGASALQNNTTGPYNTASGASALGSNTTGGYNTASGGQALQNNTTGFNNTASGYTALFSNTTGGSNIALGSGAGYLLTTGSNNIDIGHAGVAGESNIIRIGDGSTQTDTFLTGVIHGNGSGLTGVATSALTGTITSAQLASGLTLSGTTIFSAGLSLPATTGATVGVITQGGTRLMHSFGPLNFFAGAGAGNFTTTGQQNMASGVSALNSNSTGNSNTASGASALQNNTTGSYNMAGGAYALGSNTTGGNNTASGGQALQNNTTGFSNTASGYTALFSNTTGGSNIALGAGAGYLLTTGSNNIDIGHAGVAGESNIIRIGDGSTQTDTFLTGIIHGNGSGLTGLTGIDAANIATGTLADARLSANIPRLSAAASTFTGDITATGMTQFGSGTGTSEAPNKPLIIRRANTTSSTAGQVVAKTDKLSLERDGTFGGWRISWVANPGNNTIAFTGLTGAGATVNFVTILTSPGTAGTVAIFTDAQNVISLRGSFGNSYNADEQTEVSLSRYPTDNYWTGTIISTVNQ